jgi:hypothetical protein
MHEHESSSEDDARGDAGVAPNLIPTTPEGSEAEERDRENEMRVGCAWVSAPGEKAGGGERERPPTMSIEQLEQKLPALKQVDTLNITPSEVEWQPERTVDEWAEIIWQSIPEGLRWWVREVEGADPVHRASHPLQLLQKLVEGKSPVERLGFMRLVFESQGCPPESLDWMSSVESVFSTFPSDTFGRAEFTWEADTAPIERVLSVVDCFLTLVEPEPLPAVLTWESGVTKVCKPINWRAGGVHRVAERWESMPELHGTI